MKDAATRVTVTVPWVAGLLPSGSSSVHTSGEVAEHSPWKSLADTWLPSAPQVIRSTPLAVSAPAALLCRPMRCPSVA